MSVRTSAIRRGGGSASSKYTPGARRRGIEGHRSSGSLVVDFKPLDDQFERPDGDFVVLGVQSRSLQLAGERIVEPPAQNLFLVFAEQHNLPGSSVRFALLRLQNLLPPLPQVVAGRESALQDDV